jgi:hypothetical protein
VSGDDRLRGPVRSQAAHRSEPVLELTVIGLDRIVGVPLNVMPRRRDQLLDDGAFAFDETSEWIWTADR